MRAQFLLMFQLVFIIAISFFPAACLSKKAVLNQHKEPTIRYDSNGIPKSIKGDNLSSDLDQNPDFLKLKANNHYLDIAYQYLDSQRKRFKFDSARDVFAVDKIHTDALGMTHIKLKQVYQDIPVWGKEVVVHLNKENSVYFYQGSYVPISKSLQTKATISETMAKSIAVEKKKDADQWEALDAQLYIWSPDQKNQHLAYEVSCIKHNFYRESCFVDAIEGYTLHCVSESTDMK